MEGSLAFPMPKQMEQGTVPEAARLKWSRTLCKQVPLPFSDHEYQPVFFLVAKCHLGVRPNNKSFKAKLPTRAKES